MKTISFFNRKGGPGKTALSFMFSRYLAAAGKKVLFLDLDPQRTATNHFARLEDIKRQRYLDNNIFNVLMDKQSIKDAIIPAGRVSLLASSYDLSEISATISPIAIKEILKGINRNFDYCIIDHAPNFSALIQAGIFASNIIIVPSLPTVESFEQVEWTLQRISKIAPGIKVHVIINQFKGEHPAKLERELLEYFGPVMNDFLLKTSIPLTKLVQRYTATGEQITSVSAAKKDFLDRFSSAVNEITGNEYHVEAF